MKVKSIALMSSERLLSALGTRIHLSVKKSLESHIHERVPKSPQILELSGIGDKNVLEPLGITTCVHLPGVGANLQEHYGTFTICGL